MELTRTLTRRTLKREKNPVALEIEEWSSKRDPGAASIALVSIRFSCSEHEAALELVSAADGGGEKAAWYDLAKRMRPTNTSTREVLPFRLLLDASYTRGEERDDFMVVAESKSVSQWCELVNQACCTGPISLQAVLDACVSSLNVVGSTFAGCSGDEQGLLAAIDTLREREDYEEIRESVVPALERIAAAQGPEGLQPAERILHGRHAGAAELLRQLGWSQVRAADKDAWHWRGAPHAMTSKALVALASIPAAPVPLTRVPSFNRESLTQEYTRTATNSKAIKRILKELTSVSLRGASVEALDGDVTKWEIHLGLDVWRGSPLADDLVAHSQATGAPPEVVVEAQFPESYPTAPPMLRVVRPRFQPLTGGVYGGGGVCMEKLVRQTWRPSFTMTEVLVDLRDTMVDQGGRIDIEGRSEYHQAEANAALTRLRRLQSATELPQASSFSRRVQAYPPVVSDRADMWSLDASSSVVLSQECLEELHALGLLIPSGRSFKVKQEGMCLQITARNGAQAYCGLIVDEPAPTGRAYVPYAVMQGLGVRDGESVGLKMVLPPRAQRIGVQLSRSAVMSPALRNKTLLRLQHMAAVGLGDSLALDSEVFITVVHTEPAAVVQVTAETELIQQSISNAPAKTSAPSLLELKKQLSKEEVTELKRVVSREEIVGKTPPMRWAQRKDRVLLTIELVGCDDASLTFTQDGGMLFTGTAGGSHYKVDTALFGGVDVAQSQWDVHGRDIKAMVMKEKIGWWDRLFSSGIKAKCDWDKWKDEDDEEETNEDFGTFAGGQRGVADASTSDPAAVGNESLAQQVMAAVAESQPEIVEQAMLAAGGDAELAAQLVANFVAAMDAEAQQAATIAQQRESGAAVDITVGYMRMDGVTDSIELTTNDPAVLGESVTDKKKWLEEVRLRVAQSKGWDPTSLTVWIEGQREETMLHGGMSAGFVKSQGTRSGLQSINLRFSRPGGFGGGISVQTSMTASAMRTPEGKRALLEQVRAQLAGEHGWPVSSITIWIDGDQSSKIQGDDEAAAKEDDSDEGPYKLCSNGCGFFGEDSLDGMCQACAQKDAAEAQEFVKPKFAAGEGDLEFIPTGESCQVVGLKRPAKDAAPLYTIELPDGFRRDAVEADLRKVQWGEGAGKAAVGWLLKKPKKKPDAVPAASPGAPAAQEEKPTTTKTKKKKKKDSNRCAAEGCRKKLALSAISCACGLRFLQRASVSRAPRMHL